MKKILAMILAAVLLALCVPTVFAAGNISWKGPDTVRAGDTITLTFSAGGGIYGGSGSVSYDSALLTLKSYKASVGGSWAVEFIGDKFVFYDNSMASPISGSTAIFKATFVVNKDLPQGTELNVSLKNVKLSDGGQDINMGSRTYSAVVAPPLSDNCRLASLTVENADISPEFSADVTAYTASVPFTTSSLKLRADAEHPGAKVTVKNPTLTAGGTTTVSVTVKAENGETMTYTIRVKRAQDPNYVPGNNAKLAALTVEGFQISPAFSPDVTGYYVWLPYETEAVKIAASAEDGKAAVKIGETVGLEAGKGTQIAVTVTAEDGTQLVYTVTAVRAPAHADTENFLDPQPTEPQVQPTEPPTEPTTTPEVPVQTQAPYTTLQIVTLAGSCVICLIVGVLLGVLFKHLAYKKKYGQDDI